MSDAVDRLETLNSQRMVAWKNTEETQFFLQFMRGVVLDMQEAWLKGHFDGSNQFECIVENARAQGRAQQAQLTIDVINGIKLPGEDEK